MSYPSPRIRLRQIAIVAPDLARSGKQLDALLNSKSVFSDPGVGKFGLENILCPVGGVIFEVVAPQPGKRNEEIPGGRFMLRLGAPKGAGYMVITQVPDPLSERSRVTSLQVPKEMAAGGNQGGAQKVATPGKIRTVAQMDRTDWAYTQFHPVDIRAGNILEMEGTKPPSIDFLSNEFAPWYPVSLENPANKAYEPTWWVPFAKQQAPGKRVIGVTISVAKADDPTGAAGVSAWWSKIMELPVEKRGNAHVIMLNGGVELRFVDNTELFKGAENVIEHLAKNTAITVVDIGCVKGSPSASASYSSAVHALGATDAGTWLTTPSLEGKPAIQAMGVWFRYTDLPEGSTRGLAVPASQARL